MNRIFKVIWSKTKHCYIVVSEYAKANTKAVHTGLRTTAAAVAAAAMLLAPVNYNYAWAADTVTVEEADTSTTTQQTQTVYTTDGADKTFATKADAAVQDAGVVKADKKIGENVTALGKGLYDETAARIGADAAQDKVIQQVNENLVQSVNTINKNVADGFTALNTADANEAKARTDADAAEKAAREAGDTTLDTRITKVKEYLENQTSENYVSKTDAAVQDGAIVKADKTIGENVTNLDAALAKETAARIGADAAQNKVIQQVNANLVESVTTINKNVADGFTALNQADANEAAARKKADNELNERITAEAQAILETTSKMQEDAAVQDGAIVKADKTIGENVTNLDAALAKETAARLGADAAQDKVIKQVNDNLVASVNTINKNVADGFTALNQADAKEAQERAAADTALDDKITAETSARVAADTKLVEATNGGLSLDNDNVLQKTKTEISSTGEVTTFKEAATTLILNKDADNQVKIDSEGVTVGTSSTQMDAEGFTAGGHDYDAAGAALMSDGRIKGANGDFTVDKDGNAISKATITGETVTDGKGASMSNGTVTGKTLTDGIATITNGNINTSGSVTGGIVTSTGNISAVGDIHVGGAITGASASIQGTLTAGSATITGDLTAGGAIQGKSISDGTATMQNGNITGVKNLSAETITTSGDATIGGDLTVKGQLNVDEIDLTKTGIVGDNNVTARTKVAAGEITSYKKATNTKDRSEKESAIDYDENSTSTWVKATDADGNWNKSTLTVEGDDVKSKVIDSEKNSNLSTQTSTQSQSTLMDKDSNTNVSTQTASESSSVVSGKDGEKTYKSYITQNMKKILQGIKNGTNESIINQTETGIKSTATDGKNTASTNLSNKGFNTYATDGTNKTYTLQTAESLTSQIGDDGKVKSVMNADGITNNADGGTITNSAKDLVNKATGNMTNTVGGKLLNDVTGDMENKVGGNLTTTVSGTSTETVTGKKTETYNDGLETTVTGEEKHTVNGSQTNTIGGSQTTTVTGDSSLTAENITNEAKNKITNKALDVETDATSSIVQKVTNAAGSNTSTQLSYQTTEEMKAGGKTASYLRGAAEEKSQLINGSEKTTIDTIAGQTNSNITDGTNTSNDLQKADQIASSVTDGTNTTVVNQNAKSLASSITDGTKANNTNSTVDKSEQLIKASDTHFYAETRTAEKAEEALRSDNTVINIVKDTKTATVSSAVTDGATITGISQNAKDISLSAAGGTITNTAKKLVNTATGDMENKVGGNLTNNVTGNMTSNVTGDSSLSAKNITNTAEEKLSNSAAEIENSASKSITDKVGANVERTMTTKKISESVKDGTKSNSFSKTAEKDINIITDGTKTSTLSQLADSVNTSLKEVDGEGKTTKSLSNLKTVSEDTTKMTDAATGEFSKRSQTVSQIQDQVGETTVTTTEGLTKLTNEGGTHKTEMDFADVLKDLGVRGNAAVDGNTTLGKKDADTTLTVNSKSTFKDTVKMEKTLEVDGNSNFNNKVTVTKGGLNVTGGTTTDTLHVTRTSTFDGTATFKDIVTMEQDLSVGGNATVAGDVTANSYKVGDKTYIDANGINANSQKITNVAAGTEDSDAANYGQLRKVERRVDGVENRVTNVENRVDKMDSRIDKVGANAAAMANLHPLEFDEDSKWNVAAAVGNYKGETAAAVGAFYRPNEDVMFNLSTTFGNDENMVGGGLSLRLGKGGNREKDKKLKAAIVENNDLRAKVDDLTARMDALLSVINPNMSKEFPDVPENHWAYEAVTRLAGNDIVQGYEDGKFHGERTMTRYEMAELIYNALSRGAKAEKKLVEEFKPELQAMAAQKQAK